MTATTALPDTLHDSYRELLSSQRVTRAALARAIEYLADAVHTAPAADMPGIVADAITLRELYQSLPSGNLPQ